MKAATALGSAPIDTVCGYCDEPGTNLVGKDDGTRVDWFHPDCWAEMVERGPCGGDEELGGAG